MPCLLIGWFVATLLVSGPAMAPAQEEEAQDDDSTDILAGFDEDEESDTEGDVDEEPLGPPEVEMASWWEVDGFLRLDSTVNYAQKKPEVGQPDYRGLSKLRQAAQIELSLKPVEDLKVFASGQAFYDVSYVMRDRGKLSDELLQLYQWEVDLRETYMQCSPLSMLDVKIGRQIVVWGFADYLRIVDMLNPLDNREPGLVDIEDLRLPVTMSRLDFYAGRWNLSAVAVHETRFNKDPVYNSDFYPFAQPSPNEVRPAHGFQDLKNTEIGLALTSAFSGWDLGVYAAYLYDDIAHMEVVGASDVDDQPVPLMERRHSRLLMGGLALDLARGRWLLKSEAAWLRGLEFANLPGETRWRLDTMLGVEYSLSTETTMALEAVNRHLLGFEFVLKQPPDGAEANATGYMATIRSDQLRQRLHLVGVIFATGKTAEQGMIQRYSIGYDLFDASAVTGGVLVFHGGNEGSIGQAWRKNDRIFIEAKYSF